MRQLLWRRRADGSNRSQCPLAESLARCSHYLQSWQRMAVSLVRLLGSDLIFQQKIAPEVVSRRLASTAAVQSL